MIHRFMRWLGTKTLSFIHIQLFVSIVSLPILVAWGLPISIMAPVGNLFFGPFLTVFLGISCIIFFTEILNLPNGIFIEALGYLTHIWQTLLNYGTKKWLLSFPNPSPWFFIFLILITIAVVYHKRLQSTGRSSICFALILVLAYGYLLFLNTPRYGIAQIPWCRGHITVIKTPSSCTIIDPGILGSRISAPSWVEYTLLPKIRSDYGANCIEHMVILAPGIVTFDALAELIRIIPIKHIYVVIWQGENPPGLAKSYNRMKAAALNEGVELHRFGKKEEILNLDSHSSVAITPLDAQCTYRTVKYPALKVIGLLPDDTIQLYSSKYAT